MDYPGQTTSHGTMIGRRILDTANPERKGSLVAKTLPQIIASYLTHLSVQTGGGMEWNEVYWAVLKGMSIWFLWEVRQVLKAAANTERQPSLDQIFGLLERVLKLTEDKGGRAAIREIKTP